MRTPIVVAANSVDAVWAPPASRDAFMAGYRQAPLETLTLRPDDFGLRAIASPVSTSNLDSGGEYSVKVAVMNADNEPVFAANITMWVSSKK